MPREVHIPPTFIAICGGSGAGKSWLATALRSLLGKDCGSLSLDDFYRDRSHLSAARRARINFDHPRAIDWPELLHVMDTLAAGKTAVVPCYDFATHCRRSKGKELDPHPMWIVEGLWLLRSPALRRRFELKIFVECASPTRLARRLSRDMATRARTRASVRLQFRSQVEPMHRKFIEPQKRWADIVLRSNCTPEAVADLARIIESKTRVRSMGRYGANSLAIPR